MKSIYHLSLILLITNGCSGNKPPVTPVEVKIPIEISCVSGNLNAPQWNVAQLKSEASAAEKLKAALADLDLAHGYIEELEAELAACG